MNKYSLDFLKVSCFENEKSKSLGKIQKQKSSARTRFEKNVPCPGARNKRLEKRLSFVQTHLLNKVSHEEVVNLLRKFAVNAKKRSDDFQYFWIAERQAKNDAFKGMVTST